MVFLWRFTSHKICKSSAFWILQQILFLYHLSISFEQKVAASDNVNYFYLVFCSHVSVEMTSGKWDFSIECLKSFVVALLAWQFLSQRLHRRLKILHKPSIISSFHINTAWVPWWRKVQAPRISVYCPQWPSFKPLSDFIPTPEASSFLIVLLNLSEINAAVTHPLPLAQNQ